MTYQRIPVDKFTELQIARFWLKVRRGEPGECWPWLASARSRTKGEGYGQWRCGGIVYQAHRVAYALSVGPIPEGMTLDHIKAAGCTTTLCCNSLHLEPVKLLENIARHTRSEMLYSLVCKNGHIREFSIHQKCKKCKQGTANRYRRKNPEKYREIRRLQKQRQRARVSSKP